MKTQTVICGAGIAGIATAYYLAVKHRQKGIVLLDRYLPMSQTTSKSGENFRDYWPQACMTDFVSRSLDLMEELVEAHGDVFAMRSTGYDFVSEEAGREIFPSPFLSDPDNADRLTRFTDASGLRAHRPHLAPSVSQLVRVKRAGALDVYALGALLLGKAREAGVEYRLASIDGIGMSGSDFCLHLSEVEQTSELVTPQLVLAAGPFVNELAGMLDLQLPVQNYLQRKFIIPDPARAIPRDMPFTIVADPQHLRWTQAETDLIAADAEFAHLLDEFPAGLHVKPEGRDQIKLGWAFNREPEQPRWDINDDPAFASIAIRGASRFIPALEQYIDNVPRPVVQYAGYYTRTAENWPIIGPLDHQGLYTVAALSGYGTMSACSAGELCADWIAGAPLPYYARNFHPSRAEDADIRAEIDAIESDGQL